MNAALGGTGSDTGCYRLDEHVLSHAPDLMFLEFAINDATAPQSQIEACVESILCRSWTRNPLMGVIVLVSGSRQDHQASLIYAALAQRFGLYCVDVGAEKRRLLLSEKESDESLFTDTVHPSDHGHEVYAACVIRLLDTLWTARAAPRGVVLGKEYLQWRTAEYIAARMIPPNEVDCGGIWKMVDTHYTEFDGTYPVISQYPDRTTWPFPYRHGLLRSSTLGSYLEITCGMRAVGLSIDYRQGETEVDVLVDGVLKDTFKMKMDGGRFPRYPEVKSLDGHKHTTRFVLSKGEMYVGYVLIR